MQETATVAQRFYPPNRRMACSTPFGSIAIFWASVDEVRQNVSMNLTEFPHPRINKNTIGALLGAFALAVGSAFRGLTMGAVK